MTGWLVVAEVPGRLEAEIVKSLLESSGFEVRLKGEAVGELYGLQTGPLSEIKVLVPAKDAPLAQKILSQEFQMPNNSSPAKGENSGE